MKANDKFFKILNDKAQWVWERTLQLHRKSPEMRVASSLSPIEILVVLYYGGFLKQDPSNPFWDDRDRCIISKGHGSLCMYPILADLGFFDSLELDKGLQEGSFLGGIPDPIIPGYETINGSLGHGMGVGSGMALALKSNKKSQNVYVVTGDGELHEGSNWEAFMFAAQNSLNNLILIVDNNQICMLGPTDNIVSHIDLKEKLKTFGWKTFLIENGHSIKNIFDVLSDAVNDNSKKPKAIIANTKKGNRVPGLEGAPLSHVTAVNPSLIDELIGKKDNDG